mgnify:CR=1 FL=1
MAATNHAQAIKQDSQTYLATALLQLLQTKDLSDITVTQVVKRAGVSRMEFYRNFETLADILTAYFKPAIDARFDDIRQQVDVAQKQAAISQFFKDYADLLRLASERGFELVIQQLFAANMQQLYAELLAPLALTESQRKYWPEFMSAGVYAIWRTWLISDQPETLATIHQLLATFQTSTLQALLKG